MFAKSIQQMFKNCGKLNVLSEFKRIIFSEINITQNNYINLIIDDEKCRNLSKD